MKIKKLMYNFLKLVIITFLILTGCKSEINNKDLGKTNFIIIIADDLGYGDLSCQGHPLIRTPNIDRLAMEGQRWTSFYASSCVCNPSRAALLTGRLAYRIHGGKAAWGNVPAWENTIAEILKKKDYATACIGKWQLGMEEGEHPNDQGFDYFYGLEGSNDAPFRNETGFKRTLENIRNATFDVFDIALYRQKMIIEDTVHQDLLTQRYTEESVKWIRQHSDAPFFLYLAYNMPHVPIYPSPEFKGHSKAGIYGDVVEEIDWSVGEIVKALKEARLEKNTLVVFTSDNGPWLTYFDLGGSPGPLRDGKFTAWEGGFRVPGIFWWPGTISPAVIDDIGANADFMATVASLAGISLPDDRAYDSYDLSPTLLREEPSNRKEWYYYGIGPDELWAVRVGNYKLHFISRESIGTEEMGWRGYSDNILYESPILFELNTDIRERFNVTDRHLEIVKSIQEVIDQHNTSIAKPSKK
jgi:arylsulfatase A-like enzyme